MKHLVHIALFCLVATSLHAQAVDTTVCDVLKDPSSFNGKTVRIKATVSSGFDEFIIKAEDCKYHIGGIWLAYPEGTKAKSGPVALLQLQPAANFAGTVAPADRAPITLDKSKDFKQFDSLLAAPYKGNNMCLGCTKSEVGATLIGRIDAVKPDMRRDAAGKIIDITGFGNLNAYPVRLVLQSVTDATAREIDYSKSAAITKSETSTDSPSGDATASVHAFAKVFGASSPLGDQVERAAAAFGKQGEDNGVTVVFSGMNEASLRLEQKGSHASPDGVLYNCTFDSSRLKGNALALAIAHMGEHVADIRDPKASSETLYGLENRGWITTALTAIGARQKSLTIPGGYLIWNAAWPPADINKLSSDALSEFLKSQALLQ
ncbi:hypothetical protein P8935_12085 [Telmatobacter sp. DSM 110680]|uniref:Uncharacterized protein n=1 Tax=Telmatobacter sp. DSM 110680 TaxID=3036704 RepID=A0AAU7DQF1_9BACT